MAFWTAKWGVVSCPRSSASQGYIAPWNPFARAFAIAAFSVTWRKSTSERATSGWVASSEGNIQVSESQKTCP